MDPLFRALTEAFQMVREGGENLGRTLRTAFLIVIMLGAVLITASWLLHITRG